MLNEKGGVIDDLIIYFMTEWWFRLVVNAGTRARDLAWIRQQAQAFRVEVRERRKIVPADPGNASGRMVVRDRAGQ